VDRRARVAVRVVAAGVRVVGRPHLADRVVVRRVVVVVRLMVGLLRREGRVVVRRVVVVVRPMVVHPLLQVRVVDRPVGAGRRHLAAHPGHPRPEGLRVLPAWRSRQAWPRRHRRRSRC